MDESAKLSPGRPRHLLFMLVDGLGIPVEPLDDGVYAGCPALCRCIAEHSVPLDATLGMPGEPQSATGQTALFTGVNAAQVLGRHLAGFPNAELRKIIREHNIFQRLSDRGLTCAFGNAYVKAAERRAPRNLQSVTTVATLAALGDTRKEEDLQQDRAVYHDLTRRSLHEKGMSRIPEITEETAADHLLTVLREHDFTVFEYFLTDRAGHRGTLDEKVRVLQSLDRFLARLISGMDKTAELLVWTSDHGNIESNEGGAHTRNPVPLCAVGWHESEVRQGLTRIDQVAARIEDVLAG